ncbi:uncharacterized protein B0H64DRAFT_169189 [Chaetomium fimeti]|uniref:Uncharacterized protein n=1 Tax=Chaetomium fimeti TaxID=1854472 RepID=A0AAE0LT64_9PEZI|nr:hypothetical protein B0H64DRAFT_169189 [Chaetomium fimeti]
MPDMHCMYGDEDNAVIGWFPCFMTAPATGMTVPVVVTRAPQSSYTTIQTVTSPELIYAHGVKMVYQATDFVPPSTGSVTASTYFPTSSELGTGSESGLSTGATVAIGVTIPLAVLGASVAALLVWRRKRGQRMGREAGTDWLKSHELPTKPHERMLPDRLYEMSGEGVMAEMPATRQTVELPGY